MRAVLSIAFALALLVTALRAGATETGPGGGAIDPCLHTCQMEAEQVYHACTEHGGSSADCLNTAKQALSACRDAHCTAPGGGGPGDGGGGTTSSGDGSCRDANPPRQFLLREPALAPQVPDPAHRDTQSEGGVPTIAGPEMSRVGWSWPGNRGCRRRHA